MYCTSCGKQIANDAVFCRYCGKPVSQGGTFAELVAAARAGDQNAVSALYERTYSKVYYTVKSMIRDEDTVFDIVQDAYIKAFAHLDSFQGDEGFLPWVRQIAANTARDWLKRKRPMLFTELNSGDGQETPVEELFPDERGENLPEQVIDQEETRRLLREIIEELPEDQRAAIGMFYYEELSVKEIAAAMGASESAVKSRLMYGRNKIEKKVRELEKQGTKLYGLSPIPFLLLLFRSQKTYGAVAPDGRILHTILALRPMGAVAAGGAIQGAGMAGRMAASGTAGADSAGTAGAASAGVAGAAGAGTGAAAGGLGALKISLIALTVVAVSSLGVFGATRLASRVSESREPSALEGVLDWEELQEELDSEDIDDQEEPEKQEESEEPSPIDEALEQYRVIIGQADSYEYGSISSPEAVVYAYALVQLQPDDPVPTLLLEKGREEYAFTRVFQYDPDTKTVQQPYELVLSGRGTLYPAALKMAGDGDGMLKTEWSSQTGQGDVVRITLDGDSLNRDTIWKGQLNQIPGSITFTDIEWHEIGNLSALDSWTAPNPGGTEPSGPSESETLPTDGDRIVLTGTVRTFNYDEIVVMQGCPDPNIPYGDNDESLERYFEHMRSISYRVIVLDTPQTLRLYRSGEELGSPYYYSSSEALMLSLDFVHGMNQYEGQHIMFSINPDNTRWPTADTGLPYGQPIVGDIHIFDGEKFIII